MYLIFKASVQIENKVRLYKVTQDGFEPNNETWYILTCTTYPKTGEFTMWRTTHVELPFDKLVNVMQEITPLSEWILS